MSKLEEEFRRIQLETLSDMKKRRDMLDKGIADLEHSLDNPTLHIDVDFAAIAEEARRDAIESDTRVIESFISRRVDPRLYIGTYYAKFAEGTRWRLPEVTDYER